MNEQIIEDHLIGRLGSRLVRELFDAGVAALRERYMEKQSSRSLLGKLVTFLRAIIDMAVDRRLLERNPARKLRSEIQKAIHAISHTPLEECDLLLAQVPGADHLAVRLLDTTWPSLRRIISHLRRKDCSPTDC